MSRPFVIAVTVALGMAVPAVAQQPTGTEAGAVRVTTRLVEVSVTAVDRHGKPVPNLKRGDFELYDQGEPQQIASFSELRSPLQEDATAESRASNTPGYFSNFLEGKDRSQQTLTIVLFDQLNTPLSDQTNAREQLLAHFRDGHPGGLTAVFVLNDGVKMLCNYTSSSKALRESAANIRPTEPTNRLPATPKPAATGLAPDVFENWVRSREASFYLPERRIRPTLEAFRAIAESLAGIPGRKNLIWLSGSFPISVGMTSTPLLHFYRDGGAYDSQLNNLARRMSAANIAVYPIDVRGISSLDLGEGEDHIPPIAAGLNWGSEGPAGTMDAATATAVAEPDASFSFTMHEIADWTGGRAFLGSNDVRGEIRQAMADGQQNYLLSFYPQGVPWDGNFHELRIVVKQLGVKVRSRKGYFASNDGAENQTEQEAQLMLAESSSLDCTSLPFTVLADTRTVNKVAMLRTKVEVNGKQLNFAVMGDTRVAHVKLVFLQQDGDKQFVDRDRRSLTFRLTRPQFEAAARQGLRFTTSVPLQSMTSQFRVVMQDLSTGNIGALTFAVAGLPHSD